VNVTVDVAILLTALGCYGAMSLPWTIRWLKQHVIVSAVLATLAAICVPITTTHLLLGA